MRSTDPADYQSTPQPMAAMAKDFPSGSRVPAHRHRRAQLIFASSGVMTVTSQSAAWVVPPEWAIWMPAGVEHAIHASGLVRMRTLYVDPSASGQLPASCAVVPVTPLLRELLLAAVRIPLDYLPNSRDGRVMALILDEIRVRPSLGLHLPMPGEQRLRQICDRLLAEPANAATAAGWAGRAGISSRTLARRFQRETGMSFARWRQQARLLRGLQVLAERGSVLVAALEAGYDSPSAFSAMVRRILGVPPSAYFGGREQARSADADLKLQIPEETGLT